MKKILIGLTGKARVGKDTAATYLQDSFFLERYALADPIKNALHAMGFNRKLYDNDVNKEVVIPALGVSYRKMCQTLGTEWGRATHPEFWLILARMHHAQQKPDSRGMVVSDIRFENEAAWIREAGGTVVHVVGPQREQLAQDGQGHASEAGVAQHHTDYVVHNSGSITFLCGQLYNLVTQLQ